MDFTKHPNIHIQTHQGVSWIDVINPSPEQLIELEHVYHVHPIQLKESIQNVQHYTVERRQSYLFFVLHCPLHHRGVGAFKFGQIGIFLGKDYLLTIRTADTSVFTHFADSLQANDYADFTHGAGYILYMLIRNLLNELSGLARQVLSQLDQLEDSVFDNSGSDAMQIGKVRQRIVRLMRIIGPKKIMFHDLTEQIESFGGKTLVPYYSYNAKTVNELWEVIQEAKETIEIYKDADFTISTERNNQILAVLTIIFTFTIPITVIGTLYGTNVLLPGGLVAGSWTFFGPYTTLIMIVAFSLLVVMIMYRYFHQKRWL